MRYEHCIFDLYGTLVDIHTDEESPQLWAEMARYYSERGAAYRPEELHSAYRSAVAAAESGRDARYAHEAHPEIQIEGVFRQLFQQKGADADPVQAGRFFRKCSTEYIRLYDGAAALLDGLRKRGRRVYLLSNAQRLFTAMELEELGLTPMFDRIFLSSDYGVKKPDRRFFELLLRECGIPVNRAVMIGNDGACDIRGAQAVGLAAIYLRSNISPDEPLPQADLVLEKPDLGQVLEFLLEDDPGPPAV